MTTMYVASHGYFHNDSIETYDEIKNLMRDK